MSLKRTFRNVRGKLPALPVGDPELKEEKLTAAEHIQRVTRATDAFDSLTEDEKETFMLYHHMIYNEKGPRVKLKVDDSRERKAQV